jgi:hypothetical protein
VFEENHDMRQNSEEKLNSIFVKTLEIASTTDVRLVVPRHVGRQQNCGSYKGIPETHYHLYLFHFIFHFYHLLDQLKSRFLNNL